MNNKYTLLPYNTILLNLKINKLNVSRVYFPATFLTVLWKLRPTSGGSVTKHVALSCA